MQLMPANVLSKMKVPLIKLGRLQAPAERQARNLDAKILNQLYPFPVSLFITAASAFYD